MVTDRRRDQKTSLQISEAHLERVHRLAGVANFEVNLPLNPPDNWPPHVFEVLGLDPEKDQPALEDYIATVVHPDDRAKFVCVRRAVEEGVPYELEHRIVRPNGEIRYLHAWAM